MKELLSDHDRDALIKYRFERAAEAYDDAMALLQQNRLNVCVNRIYYSCFYAVIAVLLKEGIETKSHDGVKRMFGLKIVKANKIDKNIAAYFSLLYNARITGDYDEFVEFSHEEVEDMLNKASTLIAELKKIVL